MSVQAEEKATEKVVVTRMSEAINSTEGSEYVPVISADGKTLLFCGRFREDSVGGEDIYISHWTEEGWGKAEPLMSYARKRRTRRR